MLRALTLIVTDQVSVFSHLKPSQTLSSPTSMSRCASYISNTLRFRQTMSTLYRLFADSDASPERAPTLRSECGHGNGCRLMSTSWHIRVGDRAHKYPCCVYGSCLVAFCCSRGWRCERVRGATLVVTKSLHPEVEIRYWIIRLLLIKGDISIYEAYDTYSVCHGGSADVPDHCHHQRAVVAVCLLTKIQLLPKVNSRAIALTLLGDLSVLFRHTTIREA